MSKKSKVLSGRRDNNYFNYRSGVYNRDRNYASLKFVILLVFVMAGGFLGSGYIYLENTTKTLSSLQKEENILKPVSQLESDLDKKIIQLKEDKVLTETVKDHIDEMPKGSDWFVSVRDLSTGSMSNIDADKTLPAGSMYELFMIAPLERKLSSEYWTSYLSQKPVERCVVDMMASEDEDCARGFGYYANFNEINTVNNEIGFNQTNIDYQTKSTSVKDMSEMIYRLQKSQIHSDKARRLIFDGLYQDANKRGVAKACGEGCLVASKTAEVDGYMHNVAVVTNAKGARYVVAISAHNASWGDVEKLAQMIDADMQLP